MQYKNIVHTTEYMKEGQPKKKYTTVGTLFVYDRDDNKKPRSPQHQHSKHETNEIPF